MHKNAILFFGIPVFTYLIHLKGQTDEKLNLLKFNFSSVCPFKELPTKLMNSNSKRMVPQGKSLKNLVSTIAVCRKDRFGSLMW